MQFNNVDDFITHKHKKIERFGIGVEVFCITHTESGRITTTELLSVALFSVIYLGFFFPNV